MKNAENEQDKKLVQVQMDKKLWEEAQEKARKNDLTLSQVIRKLLSEYISDPQGRLAY